MGVLQTIHLQIHIQAWPMEVMTVQEAYIQDVPYLSLLEPREIPIGQKVLSVHDTQPDPMPADA